MRKNYILDANILIHDPQSIFQFADNTVVIPVEVITEIDRFKKEMTDRGFNARTVVRLLDGLRDGRSLAEGVALDNGGLLKVYCEPDQLLNGHPRHADTEILRVARKVHEAEPRTPVIIITKDINLRIRADAAGFRAEDYESDHVRPADVDPGHSECVMPAKTLETLRAGQPVPADDAQHLPNEYLLLRAESGGARTVLARVGADGESICPLDVPEQGVCGVRPKNKEQYFAIDALLNPEIQLVTLMGKAGTGKTLLAVAAAIQQVVRRKQYKAVLICRPVVPVGRDLGFLPGDINRKIDPWMKPIADTVEFLLETGGPIRGVRDVEKLMTSGIIEIQPLTYIRGRNIAKRLIVLDEVQNLTPLEVKTVITRLGHDAKVVLTGDPNQIDNPYIDAYSNGFTYLVNRFRGQPIAAHVHLHKGERSSLAEVAANLL